MAPVPPDRFPGQSGGAGVVLVGVWAPSSRRRTPTRGPGGGGVQHCSVGLSAPPRSGDWARHHTQSPPVLPSVYGVAWSPMRFLTPGSAMGWLGSLTQGFHPSSPANRDVALEGAPHSKALVTLITQKLSSSERSETTAKTAFHWHACLAPRDFKPVDWPPLLMCLMH